MKLEVLESFMTTGRWSHKDKRSGNDLFFRKGDLSEQVM